jgi:hypothetical protein
MAWFKSPPGEESKTASPAVRWAHRAELETSPRRAAPILPLRASACLPTARTSDIDLGDLRRGQARRDVLVFPVSPGLGSRTGPSRRECDTGSQENKDEHRPIRPPPAAGRGGAVKADSPAGAAGATRGPVGDPRKARPSPLRSRQTTRSPAAMAVRAVARLSTRLRRRNL